MYQGQVQHQLSAAFQEQDHLQQMLSDTCCRILGEMELILQSYQKNIPTIYHEFAGPNQSVEKRMANIHSLRQTTMFLASGCKSKQHKVPNLQIPRLPQQNIDQLKCFIETSTCPHKKEFLELLAYFRPIEAPDRISKTKQIHQLAASENKGTSEDGPRDMTSEDQQEVLGKAYSAQQNLKLLDQQLANSLPLNQSRYDAPTKPLMPNNISYDHSKNSKSWYKFWN